MSGEQVFCSCSAPTPRAGGMLAAKNSPMATLFRARIFISIYYNYIKFKI